MAPMNPRANGVSKAQVEIVSIALAKLVNKHMNNWYEFIPVIWFTINCTPMMVNGLPPFLLQHAWWPEDPASLALLGNTTPLKTHLEYFTLIIEKVRMWQKVAITHRRLYNDRMEKAYGPNLRLPTKLSIGEFCYLRLPYLSTITSHVKRLSIPWRGPFIISDILPDGRLVCLVRISHFTQLPKLNPIHHIKCTKYGLDPPKFAYLEGITPESDEWSDEGDDNIEYEIYVSQPWDDKTTVSVESNPSEGNDKQSQNLIDNSEPIQHTSEQNPDDITFTDQLWVRVLPKLGQLDQGL